MSAAKHTPGPWVVADDVVFQIRAGDMHVADVRGWGHLTGRGALGLPEMVAEDIQRANARLIAAAPDYDIAARAVVTAWDESEIGQLDGALIESLRAAIAKAEGQR